MNKELELLRMYKSLWHKKYYWFHKSMDEDYLRNTEDAKKYWDESKKYSIEVESVRRELEAMRERKT